MAGGCGQASGALGVGGRPPAKALRGGSKAAKRMGIHQTTQPVAKGTGAEVRRVRHARWLRLNQGYGSASLGTPKGNPRNGASKNDCASSLGADCTDALQQRKRQESLSFRRRKRRNS